MKISGVYEIINKITGDFYIGSSIDLEKRKRQHFWESTWKCNPNKQLYKDMKQYDKNNFLFKPIWLCDHTELKKYEQIAIEKYNPKYNIRDAYTGMSKEEYHKKHYKKYYKKNADRIKQRQKQYQKEHADSIKKYNKKYYKENTDIIKQRQKQYRKEQADKIKQYQKEHADSIKQYHKQYYSQQCLYKNELLTFSALKQRFIKKGIKNPTQEVKKYLVGE